MSVTPHALQSKAKLGLPAAINNYIRLSVIIMMLKCKYNKESLSRRTMLYVVDNADDVSVNFHIRT